MERITKRAWLLALGLALAGCNPAGSTVATAPPTTSAPVPGAGGSGATSTPTTAAMATVRFTIAVSGTPTSSSARRAPQYVSTNTQSMVISLNTVDGGAPAPAVSPVTVAIAPGGAGCPGGAGSYVCSATMAVPVGNDNFTLTAYDGAGGTGNQLSSSTVTSTISANQSNTVPVTLDPIVASLAFVPLGTPAAGTPMTVPVHVNALDASGATIVGPGTYSKTISVSDADVSGATSLNPGSTFTSSASTVTMNYSGLGILPVTLTASAPGLTSVTATFTPTLSAISASPSSLAFTSSGGGAAATVTVAETGWSNAPYNRTFPQTNTCGTGSVATVSTVDNLTFTVTPQNAGSCTMTIHDGLGQTAPVTIDVTLTGFSIQ